MLHCRDLNRDPSLYWQSVFPLVLLCCYFAISLSQYLLPFLWAWHRSRLNYETPFPHAPFQSPSIFGTALPKSSLTTEFNFLFPSPGCSYTCTWHVSTHAHTHTHLLRRPLYPLFPFLPVKKKSPVYFPRKRRQIWGHIKGRRMALCFFGIGDSGGGRVMKEC